MRLLLLIVLLSLGTVSVLAQDSWPVVQRCMGDLTYPMVQRDDWDFPGIIVSSIIPDGIHAIRGDMQVEYYIAFESDPSFASAGALSADGQYYAYPTGYIIPWISNMGDEQLQAEYLRVVRTDGNTNETYYFEVDNSGRRVGGVNDALNLIGPKWFGSDLVYYPPYWEISPYIPVNKEKPPIGLYDFRSGEAIDWTASIRPVEAAFVSPDGTRAFYRSSDSSDRTLYDLENDTLLTYLATSRLIVWFADSSAFVVVDKTGMTIVDRDGTILEAIAFPNVMAVEVTPDGQTLALWDEEQNLFLVDRQQQTIYDLCFQFQSAASWSRLRAYGLYDNLGWSPDSRSLAFSYDEHLVILDTQTLENQVIDHYSWRVMDWVPLPGETAD